MLHFKEKNILETKGIQLTTKRLSVLNAFLYFQKPINLKTIREQYVIDSYTPHKNKKEATII